MEEEEEEEEILKYEEEEEEKERTHPIICSSAGTQLSVMSGIA